MILVHIKNCGSIDNFVLFYIINANIQRNILPELHRTSPLTQELKFNTKNLNELAQQ